jgi:hypothetical protein
LGSTSPIAAVLWTRSERRGKARAGLAALDNMGGKA